MFYKYSNLGISISGIVSDETMNLMNGIYCGEVIGKVLEKRVMQSIPHVIVIAYEIKETASNNITYMKANPFDIIKTRMLNKYMKMFII